MLSICVCPTFSISEGVFSFLGLQTLVLLLLWNLVFWGLKIQDSLEA